MACRSSSACSDVVAQSDSGGARCVGVPETLISSQGIDKYRVRTAADPPNYGP
jgi:hypothetical protein